jgi:hypothetical protein
MDRSPGFGSTACNYRPVQTRFPFGSSAPRLNLAAYSNSPVRSTKSNRSHIYVLPTSVSAWFQVLFHSPPGVLFTFPSRYYPLSVAKEYLALGGGPPCFPPDSSCPAVLWIPASLRNLSPTGLLPPPVPLSRRGSVRLLRDSAGPQPHPYFYGWFGLFPFRSPLLGKSILFLFLRLLRCFSSPGSLQTAYVFSSRSLASQPAGFPHSDIYGSKPVCGSP